MTEHTVHSFAEYVSRVESLQEGTLGRLWFRGCSKSTYSLLPSLYRHPNSTSPSQVQQLEGDLMLRFKQRAIPFHDRNLSDEWELLFFMQHYGVPTRLLDWSENPFVGLYFAIIDRVGGQAAKGPTRKKAAKKRTRGQSTIDSAVWVLNPRTWNKHALRHRSFDGDVLDSDHDAINGHRPGNVFSEMTSSPVALYGSHNSPRIVAQRGAFTIFGQDSRPMEDILDEEGFPAESLVKIVIPEGDVPRLRSATLRYGLVESVIFPDLDGLAKEIKREYGFTG